MLLHTITKGNIKGDTKMKHISEIMESMANLQALIKKGEEKQAAMSKISKQADDIREIFSQPKKEK
tara:strand:+ start:587 stop:784 length:198 start_codon:yes stop_codon:yes gene_type:complete